MMDSFQTIFILLFASVLLVGIAQKIHVPYPIALVLGGTAIGFIPGLNPISFDSNLILPIVLPPILYYASFGIAFREFQQNWKNIFSLALGLVIFTTIVIGIIFKWMFPEFSWALALAFGAIVSPPDAVAATTILKRFSISPRLVSVLEGESLVNDASAIVLYKLSVVALLSGSFSLTQGVVEFLHATVGGIIIGIILGFALQLLSRNFLEPVLGVVFSFIIPYVTFITANFFEVSGVLAVVVNGLIGSRILLTHRSPLRRVLGYATWDIFIILLNCFIFVLIGLQLKVITKMMTAHQLMTYTGYAVLIACAMVIVRMIWVYARAMVAYKSLRLSSQTLHEAALIGWSGMRGIVSLSVAIALPFVLPNGEPLEGRDEVIFITFVVILMTLLIPGLTLPTLIRWLKIDATSKKFDEHIIRSRLAKVAEEKLSQLHKEQKIDLAEFDFLNNYFASQHHILKMSHLSKKEIHPFEQARVDVIRSQHAKLLEMWEEREIDDHLLSHLENELDLVDVHTARAEL